MAKRPSPDSVMVIDLTEDDEAQDARLMDIRKRLLPTSSRGTLKTEPSDQPDDRKPAATKQLEQPTKKSKIKMEDLSSSTLASGNVAAANGKAFKSDDVEVVEAVPPAMIPLNASKTPSHVGDDDVIIMGATNQLRLPHLRQHCTEFKFLSNPSQSKVMTTTMLETNSKHCDLCYCFVCDCPVKECRQWCHPGDCRAGYWNHCCADDKQDHWVHRRHSRLSCEPSDLPNKDSNAPNEVAENLNAMFHAPDADMNAPNATRAAYDIKSPGLSDDFLSQPVQGPFANQCNRYFGAKDMTKCRKCGWFTRFPHLNFRLGVSPIGSIDWCRKCGRVASDRDFGKDQANPYSPGKNDIYFGEKIIPFHIVAHDPRLFDEFKQSWAEADRTNRNWIYREEDMEEDVFHHRLGKHPKVKNILHSIPIVSKDNIPKVGKVASKIDNSDTLNCNAVSADETDAIVVNEQKHVYLLHALCYYAQTENRQHYLYNFAATISAFWDKKQRLGVSSFHQVWLTQNHRLTLAYLF